MLTREQIEKKYFGEDYEWQRLTHEEQVDTFLRNPRILYRFLGRSNTRAFCDSIKKHGRVRIPLSLDFKKRVDIQSDLEINGKHYLVV